MTGFEGGREIVRQARESSRSKVHDLRTAKSRDHSVTRPSTSTAWSHRRSAVTRIYGARSEGVDVHVRDDMFDRFFEATG